MRKVLINLLMTMLVILPFLSLSIEKILTYNFLIPIRIIEAVVFEYYHKIFEA